MEVYGPKNVLGNSFRRDTPGFVLAGMLVCGFFPGGVFMADVLEFIESPWPIAEDSDESTLPELVDDLVDYRATLKYHENEIRFHLAERKMLKRMIAELENDLAGVVALEDAFTEAWQ
jgi:hypothetical protein